MCTLPAFVDKIHDQGAEDEEDKQGDEHVVDGPDVVHLKQLTVRSRRWPKNKALVNLSDRRMNSIDAH